MPFMHAVQAMEGRRYVLISRARLRGHSWNLHRHVNQSHYAVAITHV